MISVTAKPIPDPLPANTVTTIRRLRIETHAEDRKLPSICMDMSDDYKSPGLSDRITKLASSFRRLTLFTKRGGIFAAV